MKIKKETEKERLARHKLEWSKFLTIWILLLSSYVVYHGVNLCYVMVEEGAISYNFAWLTQLIAVVIGCGDIVLAFYFSKSKAENKIKLNKIPMSPPLSDIEEEQHFEEMDQQLFP